MDPFLLNTLIEEQRARLERPLNEREFRFADSKGKVAVAIGMRRSGKTCLMLQTMHRLAREGVDPDSMLFLSFDDDRLFPLDAKGAADIVDSFYALVPENHHRTCHLFLDEIQGVEGWSRLVRRLLDTKDARLYLSGSSAKLLGKEIATELRGRSVTTEVWPYSFGEYLDVRGVRTARPPLGRAGYDLVSRHLRDYFVAGGFPETVGLDPWRRTRMLQEYVDVVVFRDVVERHAITNIQVAKYLTRAVLRNVGRPFSANKFFNDLRSQGRSLGKDTVHAYVAHFEDAFLWFAVPAHEASVRKAEVSPRKMYAVDPGLAASFLMNPGGNAGHLFENVVFLDLRRRGKEISYYITKSGYEVDFVASDGRGAAELVQVCYDASDNGTMERERRALRDAEKELGLKGRLVTPREYLDDIASGRERGVTSSR
ncbi:MAG: ATP-binding protein [Deltaproteobacteria bacterium]|nr:ATP-binding protein [Deltaproteobacteria bacterium]